MNHTVRHKNYGLQRNQQVVEIKNYTRGLAIKLFCTECLGHETNPSDCSAVCCPIFPYRGKTMKAWGTGRPLKDGEKSGYAYGIKTILPQKSTVHGVFESKEQRSTGKAGHGMGKAERGLK